MQNHEPVRLSALINRPLDKDYTVTGLALDSRLVKPGDLFFAYQGTHLDGRQFINDAIAKGASAVLIEADSDGALQLQGEIPLIPMQNLYQKVSQIAAHFFGNPAASLKMIGITGTNGKTSCSHFIAATLQQLGIPCGVIGTLGSGLYGQIIPGSLTTPDAITLQATLADFVKQGAKAVAMEVSSHSLDQGRVHGIPFEVGIFTNLTRDHLDYHGDMAAYGAAKKRLFDNSLLKYAVINADDPFGLNLIDFLATQNAAYAYCVEGNETLPQLTQASDVRLSLAGIHAQVRTPWGEGHLHIPLIGQFNLSNCLAVLTTLCLLEIPFKDALNSLTYLKSVPGRMQTLGGGSKPLIVIDYAHTPDALEKVLIALKQHCQGRLLCLFGCGGDRDRGKRPMMAKIAELYADQVIVTDDNPRHEDPAQILADIMRGFNEPSRIIVQHDRSKAIQDIIQCAVAGDCVLIAGKGAEAYQQIGDTKLPFSDIEKAGSYC
jgi:UDP-N-acetylmuramoyl-L-alanyl-D-glutamate--2,6-diaminopimelate ligase